MDMTTAAQQRIHQAALQLFAERGTTQITVSELAETAGVARGTIYNNLQQPEELFQRVATELATEMDRRIQLAFAGLSDDPAVRLSVGLRLWLRRSHAEPAWGRFITRFAFSEASLQAMWQGPPVDDLLRGVASGRYQCRPDQLPTVVASICGATVAAIFLVIEGHKTWRDAGADTVEFLLVALGMDRAEAQALAKAELPPLPELD
jgi:AcrR family transcriptional regulator